MTELLWVYVLCKDPAEARSILEGMLAKKLCACGNIIPGARSIFFWPPKSDKLDDVDETVLIMKTIESKYAELEKETKKAHSYDCPCIVALPIKYSEKEYANWIKGELE